MAQVQPQRYQQQPARKPCACVPCHDRKVRCDSAVVGTPCTRCVAKYRASSCRLMARADSSKRKRNAQYSPPPPPPPPRRTPEGQEAQISNSNASSTPLEQHMVSEEDDAHLQAVCRLSDENTMSTSTALVCPVQGQYIIEYYSQLNSLTVLGEAMGQRQRRRLIQIALPSLGSGAGSSKERELRTLDSADIKFLEEKRVYDLPPKHTCNALLRLFFEHVYPYTPILDRVRFLEDYNNGTCSTFLLYALLSNIIPYVSTELLREVGYVDITAAQKEFFLRARLLFDFGCEKGQLNLLQGSVLLSSFQNSFRPDKDFRFWFHNAVRIAMQMGFHKENLREDLDPATHKLSRRIWWVLFQRDVLFSLSGFENVRRISDEESDTSPLNENDWVDEALTGWAEEILGPTTMIQKHFFMENCKLAQLGAQFLRLFKSPSPPPISTAYSLSDAILKWRASLPHELLIERITHWSSSNVWVIFLLAMSFRLECVLYRTIRQRMQGVDLEAVNWSKQRLLGGIFELDTLLRRAMVHDVIRFCPPSLIICATNLLAFQLELALDPSLSTIQRLAAKAQIHTGLSYFRDMGERWKNAKWASRVSEWALATANLNVNPTNSQQGQQQEFLDGSLASARGTGGANGEGTLSVILNGQGETNGQLSSGQAPNGTAGIDYLNGIGPAVNGGGGLMGGDIFDVVLPDNLLQGLTDINYFETFDDGIFTNFGA